MRSVDKAVNRAVFLILLAVLAASCGGEAYTPGPPAYVDRDTGELRISDNGNLRFTLNAFNCLWCDYIEADVYVDDDYVGSLSCSLGRSKSLYAPTPLGTYHVAVRTTVHRNACVPNGYQGYGGPFDFTFEGKPNVINVLYLSASCNMIISKNNFSAGDEPNPYE